MLKRTVSTGTLTLARETIFDHYITSGMQILALNQYTMYVHKGKKYQFWAGILQMLTCFLWTECSEHEIDSIRIPKGIQ